MKDNDDRLISETIHLYFNGTYHGDSAQLQQAFHPNARITGNVKDKNFDWSLTEFITRVTTAPTSADRKELYDKRIIFIDKTNQAAIVKALVVVGELTFTDYITLLKRDDKWVIRNKSFTV